MMNPYWSPGQAESDGKKEALQQGDDQLASEKGHGDVDKLFEQVGNVRARLWLEERQ